MCMKLLQCIRCDSIVFSSKICCVDKWLLIACYRFCVWACGCWMCTVVHAGTINRIQTPSYKSPIHLTIRMAHIACYLKFFLLTIYKSLVCPDFAKEIMPIQLILCFNGGLVTWTVVSLTTAKFRPLIRFMYISDSLVGLLGINDTIRELRRQNIWQE
jgi:hypothetical protein